MKAWACAISNATDRNPDHFERREKEYSRCIERLGGVDIPAKRLGVGTMALEVNADQDVFVKIYIKLQLG